MKLSIIIPTYNERETILQLIAAVKASPVPDKEIIIVDDGSIDGTRGLLQEHALKEVDKIVFHETNQGKGAAVRSGLAHSTGEIILIQDADLEYEPAEYPELIEPILRGKADVVYGSRFLGGKPHRSAYLWHRVGNKMLTLLSNVFTKYYLTDVHTCYKVFRREVILAIKLEEDGFAFDQEITTKVAKRNYRIYEVSISYNGRSYREGKKVRWRDGFKAIWAILKYHWSSRHFGRAGTGRSEREQ